MNAKLADELLKCQWLVSISSRSFTEQTHPRAETRLTDSLDTAASRARLRRNAGLSPGFQTPEHLDVRLQSTTVVIRVHKTIDEPRYYSFCLRILRLDKPPQASHASTTFYMTSHGHIRRGKVHDSPALTRQYFHIHHYFVSITAQFHARLSCSSSCTSACTTGSSFHSAKHFITILFHVADHLIYTRLSFCASTPSFLLVLP